MFSFFKKKKEEVTDLVNEKSSLVLVKELIVNVNENINPDQILPDTLLDNLQLDSIKFMDILLSLEDILDKDLESIIEEIDLSEIEKVQDIITIIDRLR